MSIGPNTQKNLKRELGCPIFITNNCLPWLQARSSRYTSAKVPDCMFVSSEWNICSLFSSLSSCLTTAQALTLGSNLPLHHPPLSPSQHAYTCFLFRYVCKWISFVDTQHTYTYLQACALNRKRTWNVSLSAGPSVKPFLLQRICVGHLKHFGVAHCWVKLQFRFR